MKRSVKLILFVISLDELWYKPPVKFFQYSPGEGSKGEGEVTPFPPKWEHADRWYKVWFSRIELERHTNFTSCCVFLEKRMILGFYVVVFFLQILVFLAGINVTIMAPKYLIMIGSDNSLLKH